MSIRQRFCACLVAVCLSSVFVLSQPAHAQIKPPVLKITQTKLKNNLTVVLHEDHTAPIVNVQVWYHVGAKDEKPGQSGFAHLFEHIMFKGTKHIAQEEYPRLIEETGGIQNAGTLQDYTFYWQTVPANYLERVLWMESERMKSLTVNEQNFASERQVVLEEKKLRFDNTPLGKIYALLLSNVFKTYPYAHLPIGSEEDLNAATVADVKAFHDRYYVPDNATVIIVGDFNTAEVIKQIGKYFDDVPASATPVPRIKLEEPEWTEERRSVVYDARLPFGGVTIAYPTVSANHPDRHALELLSNILARGETSRLYRSLVYDKQLAIFAAGRNEPLELAGIFSFQAAMAVGKTAEEGEAALLAEIDKVKAEPVSEQELNRSKAQLISSLVRQRQTVQGKADNIGYATVIMGDYRLVNSELQKYQAVTIKDLQRVAQTYFNPWKRLVIYFLPESMRPKQSSVVPTSTPTTETQKGAN
ncbi:MAG: insulinase family protein [Acidobacteria bacterium]|nr:insulinase family protein [Acidobacteriota bacterium]